MYNERPYLNKKGYKLQKVKAKPALGFNTAFINNKVINLIYDFQEGIEHKVSKITIQKKNNYSTQTRQQIKTKIMKIKGET